MDMEGIIATELFNAVIRAVTGISPDVRRLLERHIREKQMAKGKI